MDLLDVDTRELDGWTVVVVRGQLDVATAPRFRQVLVEAQYGGHADVAIDLAGVEFLDSMGLGVLVGALKRARSHDAELVLAGANDRIRHVLELSGVAQVTRMVDRVEDVVPSD